MDAADIRTVAVIGAGTMGAGIAGVCARAGMRVSLVDRTEDLLHLGMAALRASQESLVAASRLSRAEALAAEKRVSPGMDLPRACSGADLLLEALPEDLGIKCELFSRVDSLCPPEALFASNTSGLSITRLAEATGRQGKMAGMHFWNPPHIVPLVEVVRGERTTEDTANLLLDTAKLLGKRPILVRRDVPGFVGNRLQFAVFREALHILSEGIATAEDIDAAMTAGPGLRYGFLGPLRTADLGGLDVFYSVSRYLLSELGAETEPPELLAKLVSEGRTGSKSGAGIYEYGGDEGARLVARRDRVLLAFLQALERTTESGEESHG
jgi:3-hydroxybutyryl-CoA dehydrogenase